MKRVAKRVPGDGMFWAAQAVNVAGAALLSAGWVAAGLLLVALAVGLMYGVGTCGVVRANRLDAVRRCRRLLDRQVRTAWDRGERFARRAYAAF